MAFEPSKKTNKTKLTKTSNFARWLFLQIAQVLAKADVLVIIVSVSTHENLQFEYLGAKSHKFPACALIWYSRFSFQILSNWLKTVLHGHETQLNSPLVSL